MKSRTSRFATAVAAVAMAVAGGILVAPSSGAGEIPLKTLQCGEKIVESVRLKADVGPCPGDGIVISAHGITLDLNGHEVLGTGKESGISSLGENANVSIKNGTVRGFVFGIEASGMPGAKVKNVAATENEQGLRSIFDDDLTIQDSRFLGNETGIYVEGGERLRVLRNKAVGNKVDGIQIQNGAKDVLVRDNVSRSNKTGLKLGTVFGFKVRGNTFAQNVGTGVWIGSSTGGAVKENRMNSNARGLSFSDGHLVTVKTNKANKNSIEGIDATGNNSVTLIENRANKNGFHLGVADGHGLGISGTPGTAGHNNVAAGNDDPAQCFPASLCK